MPMVQWFGEGDDAKGYQMAMIVMSILGVVLFLLCFAGTKERISQPRPKHASYKNDLKLLWQNDQWRILSLAAVFLLSGQVLRATLAVYYVKYYLSAEDQITTFMTLGMIGSILGCSLSQQIAKRVCKIKAYITLQLIAAGICIASYWVNEQQIVLAFVLFFLWSFFLQMATPLLWAKMVDTIDYGHWKTGARLNGMVFSAVVFFIKLGVAIGGATAGWLLAYYGYQAGIVQSDLTKQGILQAFTLFPAIGSVLVAAVMCWYKIDNRMVEKIHSELAEQNR